MSSERTKKQSGAEADPPPDQPDPAKTAGSRGLPDEEDQAKPGAPSPS